MCHTWGGTIQQRNVREFTIFHRRLVSVVLYLPQYCTPQSCYGIMCCIVADAPTDLNDTLPCSADCVNHCIGSTIMASHDVLRERIDRAIRICKFPFCRPSRVFCRSIYRLIASLRHAPLLTQTHTSTQHEDGTSRSN